VYPVPPTMPILIMAAMALGDSSTGPAGYDGSITVRFRDVRSGNAKAASRAASGGAN
jgi:hypothetical protein